MRRVLVCGGRAYRDRRTLNKVLDAAHKAWTVEVIIHGDAPGADTLAKQWAKAHQIQDEPYPADWTKRKKAAGPLRNQRMLDEGKPDIVFAFPGGTGTADMCRRARKAGISVLTIRSK